MEVTVVDVNPSMFTVSDEMRIELILSGIEVDGDYINLINEDGSRSNEVFPSFLTEKMIVWYLNDKIHRSGGLPAIIYSDGTQIWVENDEQYASYRNGKLFYTK